MPCVAVGHVVISILRNFSYQGLGGWEKVSLPGGLKWGSVTLLVMDLVVHAAAFGLGVKRSAIQFPWERPPLNGIFAKRPRLISPPVFVPHAVANDEVISIPVAQSEGKIRWSRTTSLIPWPIAQERALARALENWRIIICENTDGSMVGRQIRRALNGEQGVPSVEQTISDALAGKALSTLRARSSSLLAFGRWKKSIDVQSTILPITEEQAYAYVSELRQLNAPATKSSRFIEAVTFAFHMLGAEVGEAMNSPRVKGASAAPVCLPKKKVPLTVHQIVLLEELAMTNSGPEGIFAGYACMILHMRLRWSDGQFCQHEPYTDLFKGRGFLECQLYHHKNAGRQKHSKRLLPAACCVPGFSGKDWASPWLFHRTINGLEAGHGVPTMPCPLSGGDWALIPLEASQATSWLRELIRDVHPAPELKDLGTHSLKASLLSMMAKAGCEESLRRLAGYHVDPGSKMALEYSRDAQAPVLRQIEAIIMSVQHGLFNPDVSRSRRWPLQSVSTLQQAMAKLASYTEEDDWYNQQSSGADGINDGEESGMFGSDVSDVEQHVFSASEDSAASLSSLSERGDAPCFDGYECNTSDEDKEAEVAGPIVGETLAMAVEPYIPEKIFQHVSSGCCHISKDNSVDPSDGDAVVLKCGKIASKNFRLVEFAGNHLPYKCSRCFT